MMVLLLPETKKQKKKKKERITQLGPLIWPLLRTSGLYGELRQASNHYKHSNSKSELLMRYWSGILSLDLKRVSSYERNLPKENCTGWKRRAQVLDERTKVVFLFGRALIEARRQETADHGCMPVGMEAPLF